MMSKKTYVLLRPIGGKNEGDTKDYTDDEAAPMLASGAIELAKGDAKAEPAPENKAEPAPANKAEPITSAKTGRK